MLTFCIMPQVSRTIAPSKLPAHLSNHEPTSSCRNTSHSTVTKLLMESLRLLACFRPDTAYSFRSNPFQHPNTPSGVRTSERESLRLPQTTCAVLFCFQLLFYSQRLVSAVLFPLSRVRVARPSSSSSAILLHIYLPL